MSTSNRPAVVVAGCLAGLALAHLLMPDGVAKAAWYAVVGLVSMTVAAAGLRRQRGGADRLTPWMLVIGGASVWVVADWVAFVEGHVLQVESYPVVSDAFYLLGYGVLALGFLAMVRRRRSSRDLSALLDASIVAAGVGVMAAVFVLEPILADPGLSATGKVVSAAYPVMDVVLIGLLVRLWVTPLARTASVTMLAASLAATLLADVVWNLSIVVTGRSDAWVNIDLVWLSGYVLIGVAAWLPSVREALEPLPEVESRMSPRTRLVLLGAGLVLPAATLLTDGAIGALDAWVAAGVGSIVLSLLVLSRMADLLHTVQVQAVQLAALARSDALTGAPNRRTWDHELSRACRRSRDEQTPLSVAILDLDRFKLYNDTRGHQAGDRLLRESVAAWSELLEPDETLARYGGEEFALLLPGLTPEQARVRLEQMRSVTPEGQTFSAGIAAWDPATDPGAAVSEADSALYVAKRGGRDRIVVFGISAPTDLPVPRIVVQPIVDLETGEVVAEEALSRFDSGDTAQVFAWAAQTGRGAELELSALSAALDVRRPGRRMSVNISLESLVTARGYAVLPEDLSGVILEITEHGDVDHLAGTDELLARLRERGCTIAIDDWGRGHSNLDRMLRMRPELIKLDMSLVHGIGSPYHRELVSAITSWSEQVGAVVCAEGIETPEQRDELLRLGVHLGQGYYFGRPAAPEPVAELTATGPSRASSTGPTATA
jgi:diguanylate cyclase (GGDEF)-like protein